MVSLPIPLPSGAEILVKEGDHVRSGEVLAKKAAAAERSIHLASIMQVSPKKVVDYLLKLPGDNVEVGDLIARKKASLGFKTVKVHTNVSGMVTRFDEETGDLYVGQAGDTEERVIVCPIAGVVQMCNNDQIVIQTNEHILQGIAGIGATVQAPLFVLPAVQHAAGEQELLLELNITIVNTVVLGKSFTRDSLIKAIGVGCAGIIAVHIDPADIEYLQQRNMVIPIVIIAEDQVKKLAQRNGKPVFLDGSTSTILLLE